MIIEVFGVPTIKLLMVASTMKHNMMILSLIKPDRWMRSRWLKSVIVPQFMSTLKYLNWLKLNKLNKINSNVSNSLLDRQCRIYHVRHAISSDWLINKLSNNERDDPIALLWRDKLFIFIDILRLKGTFTQFRSRWMVWCYFQISNLCKTIYRALDNLHALSASERSKVKHLIALAWISKFLTFCDTSTKSIFDHCIIRH